MGEHISYIYTNTFQVSDGSAFEDFCQRHQLVPFTESNRVGFWGESYSEALITEEGTLLEELAGHLIDGQVAIVIDIAYYSEEHQEGTQPPRGVWEIAYAVSSSGESSVVNTGDIWEKANTLGKEPPTRPRWM
jgi:hypothetical protein